MHLLLARIYQQRGAAGPAAEQLKLYLKESPKSADALKVKGELEKLERARTALP